MAEANRGPVLKGLKEKAERQPRNCTVMKPALVDTVRRPPDDHGRLRVKGVAR